MAVTLKLIIVIVFGIVLHESTGCPNLWTTFNGMCYYFKETKLNWFHATHACKVLDAWLVDITSNDEESFLQATIHSMDHGDPEHIGYWTSGNDLEVEGQWVWGYPKKTDIIYTDWHPGDPNNNWYNQRGEDCVVLWGHMNFGYQWNDQPCDIEDFYICKKEDSSTGIIG